MIHRFGPFELDDQLFELRQEGRLVAIQRKAFDILCCLIKSPVVVPRADLMAKVWPGVVVTSDSLAQAIMAARAAIGDDGDKPTFIHTVRGRGYRFVAPVETLDAAEAARVIARAGAASYRFTYPLVRDVLYKRLTTSARAKLHGSVAGALATQLGDSEEDSRVAEIADHLVEAAAVGDVDAAVDCSFRAADLAKKAGDHAAAASYARRGLEAFRYAQRPDGARRARLTTFLAALP